MHENREIFAAPEGNQPTGRSVKAQNQTTDMHAVKKSDSGVVPMKHPNTGGSPLAEGVEGRPEIKENIAKSYTYPTQSRKGVSQGLSGVRQAAKERKKERFTALLHHVTIGLLEESFFALKRNAAPGVDGVSWKEYEQGWQDRLAGLHSRIHRGTYRAQPSRRIYIPKADGRERPLGIAALEDKIVQQAVVTVLNEIYETDFRGFSYGFRPGVADNRMLRLIQKWLKAGVSENGEWSETTVGTPQGAV